MQTAVDHRLNPSQVQRIESIVNRPAPEAEKPARSLREKL